MASRRRTSRTRRTGITVGLEGLEKRDCPAVVSISGPTAVEENGPAVTLTATLSEAQSRPVEVRYFTTGTATAGRDYRLSVGSTGLRVPSGAFTFRPGQTSVAITLRPVNDTAREGTETFRFNLLSARGQTLGTRSVAGEILDDDSYTASIVGPARVVAGESHSFTLQLSSPATRREVFFVSTEDRSAGTPDGYARLTNLPVVFQPGQAMREFRVGTNVSSLNNRDTTFAITVRPDSRDVPAVSPFIVTIEGNGEPGPPPGPPLTEATFTHTYGWGVVNAAAAVSKVLGGTTAFPEVSQLGGVNWGNDIVRAPEVWAQGYTGRGIVVAVVDTGVDYTHPSLRNSIWVNPREIANDGIDNDNNGFVDDVRGWDFNGNDNDPMDDVNEDGGHGTHVAGTVAAAASAYGPKGVAFDSKIMPIRFFGAETATDKKLADCIRYAASNGAHVINLSLGYYLSSAGPSVVRDAVSFATSLGAVVVAAAGNFRTESPDFPASLATQVGVVSVGAIDRNQQLSVWNRAQRSGSAYAGFSSALQHVVAPGTDVTSTVPAGFTHPVYPVTITPGGTFAVFPGTSMAAPHVAGVVALMLSAVPNPKAPGVRDRVVDALRSTSQQPPSIATMVAAAAFEAAQPGTAQARRIARAFAALRPA